MCIRSAKAMLCQSPPGSGTSRSDPVSRNSILRSVADMNRVGKITTAVIVARRDDS